MIKNQNFQALKYFCQALAVDRSGRPDVHKNVHLAVSVGRSTERSTDWRQPTLGLPRSTRRSTGQRAVALWFRARSTGRSTGRLNGQKFDRWPVDLPVDRPVDRKANSGLVSCQRADSFGGLYIPHLKWVLARIFKKKNFLLSSILLLVSKEFLEL